MRFCDIRIQAEKDNCRLPRSPGGVLGGDFEREGIDANGKQSTLPCPVLVAKDLAGLQDPFRNGKSCSLTKGLASSSRSDFWRLKSALTMICQRSSQHIPRSEGHMLRCSTHILSYFEDV